MIIDHLLLDSLGQDSTTTFAPSCNLAVSAELAARLPFDERFPDAAGEDREWSARAVAAGAPPRYVRDAIVVHRQRLDTRGFVRQQYRYGRGAARFRRVRGERRVLSQPSSYARLVRAGFERGPRVGALVVAAQVVTAVGMWRSRDGHARGWRPTELPRDTTSPALQVDGDRQPEVGRATGPSEHQRRCATRRAPISPGSAEPRSGGPRPRPPRRRRPSASDTARRRPPSLPHPAVCDVVEDDHGPVGEMGEQGIEVPDRRLLGVLGVEERILDGRSLDQQASSIAEARFTRVEPERGEAAPAILRLCTSTVTRLGPVELDRPVGGGGPRATQARPGSSPRAVPETAPDRRYDVHRQISRPGRAVAPWGRRHRAGPPCDDRNRSPHAISNALPRDPRAGGGAGPSGRPQGPSQAPPRGEGGAEGHQPR